MYTPIFLTILILIIFHIIERKFFGKCIYQVLASDNSWVAEVNTRSEAKNWKNKGYQVFKEVNKSGLIYFKQL